MTLSTPQTLVTKVSIPSVHRTWVERPRLSKRLDSSLRFPLTLICAPAGSGKTTVVTGWHSLRQTAKTPLVWVSLDEDDNDFTQFILYITTAINTVKPGIFEQALSLAGTTFSPRVMATILINYLHDVTADFVLVLDDYHLIDNVQIHELIALLVERMPPHMHLIIMTREDPPLPIGRWRANDQIIEIREAELRFSLDESRQFFQVAFGINLSDTDLKVLQRRIEGWATGLKLAALALGGQTDTGEFIQAFSGSHRYVIDYLMEEVFGHQTEDIQQFLLETSVLREMNADLCDSVTQRSNSQEILENFVQANLFTIALDENNYWFRYHHLFADTLQNRLRRKSEKLLLEIHQRAANWYRANNHYQATLHHLFEARSYSEVAQFINRHGFYFVESDGYEKPLSWIRRIPAEALTQFPDVLLLAAFLYTKTNRAHLPEVRLWVSQAQAVVNQLANHESGLLQAKIKVIESILAEDLANDRALGQLLLEEAMADIRQDADWFTVAAMQKAGRSSWRVKLTPR